MDIRKNNVVNGIGFLLATIGAIVGGSQNIQVLVYICRPLMLIILSSWFFFNSRRVGDRFTLLIQVGLFFSLVADIALMFQHMDQFNFLIALGAYLIAFLCYTMAFVHNISEIGGGEGPLVPVAITVLVAAYMFFFAGKIVPYVDDGVSIPLLVFGLVNAAMAIMAAFRFGRTFVRSFLMVTLGTFFFLASNSLLATNRFMWPLDHAEWSIVLNYGIAQYLIVAGALVHVLDPEEIRRKAALST
jgi:uncharacterized membrane protein YhhN